MLDFRYIQLSDKEWIVPLLQLSDFRGCEYSFANNMAWRRLNDTKITRYKDFYISRSSNENGYYYTFPAGRGDYKDLFDTLKKCAESEGQALVIGSVTPDKLKIFEELYPGEYTVKGDPSYNDYVYLASDLIELKGKKYHAKRNHIARFKKENWSFEALSAENQDECIELSVNFYNDKLGADDFSAVNEQFAINTYFNNFDILGLKGGVLRVDGKIVAFTIGERLNSDTYVIHIEKALGDVPGAYAVINNEFAKYAASDCKYINREEDLGIEGLRKAKRSYYPVFQVEKNIITFK